MKKLLKSNGAHNIIWSQVSEWGSKVEMKIGQEKNRVEEMKKCEEPMREKEREEFDLKIALEVSKNLFCTKCSYNYK